MIVLLASCPEISDSCFHFAFHSYPRRCPRDRLETRTGHLLDSIRVYKREKETCENAGAFMVGFAKSIQTRRGGMNAALLLFPASFTLSFLLSQRPIVSLIKRSQRATLARDL
jgi:hypothetical protein